MGPAIIKNLRVECDQTVSSSNEEIEIRLIYEDFRRFDEDLKQFGFLKSEKQNSYIASHSTGDAYKLGVLKRKLASLALQAPKVGRGDTMDASGESLQDLQKIWLREVE